MTESEYTHLIFMYYHTGYDVVMPFEEFVNRYATIILTKEVYDND